MFGRRRIPPRALPRLADALYDLASFTQPEVVRLAGSDQLRLRRGPREFLVVWAQEGEWARASVYIDPDTGEPDTSPFMQRVMRDSAGPLWPGPAGDLGGVVMAITELLIRQWHFQREDRFVTDEEKEFSTRALEAIEARMDDPRPPITP